jgi:hypothetical protein
MNRRGFLGTLFGLAVAPVVAARVLSSPPKPKYKVYKDYGGGLVGYKGTEFFEAGYVSAPYIPMQISSVPIEAKTRKLKDSWTYES